MTVFLCFVLFYFDLFMISKWKSLKFDDNIHAQWIWCNWIDLNISWYFNCFPFLFCSLFTFHFSLFRSHNFSSISFHSLPFEAINGQLIVMISIIRFELSNLLSFRNLMRMIWTGRKFRFSFFFPFFFLHFNWLNTLYYICIYVVRLFVYWLSFPHLKWVILLCFCLYKD